MSTRSRHAVSRRSFLRLLSTGSAGLVLSACVPAVSSPTGQKTAAANQEVPVQATIGVAATPAIAYEPGELDVMVCCYAPPDLEIRNKTNEKIQAAYPGLKLNQNLLPAGQNYFEKLQTLIAAGTPPDVFDMWEGYVQPYAENKVLLDLTPFLENDPKIKRDDIVPVAWDGGSWQDRLYALLIGFIPGPVSVYYNTDHFAKAGLQPPTSDWKWDDMRAAARALTDTSAKPERWGLAFDLWFVTWLYWIWSNGSDVFNKEQTQSTLTDPKATAAVQYWADLGLKDKVAIPSTELSSMQGSVNAFQTGAVSMYLGNAWDSGTFKANQDLKWKAVLSPRNNDGNRVWYMHFQCWSISSQTKLKQAAWTYIRDFVLDYEPAVQPVAPTVPSLKQLLPAFATPEAIALGYEPLVKLATQPGVLRVPGGGAKWDKISGLIQAEFDLAFAGEKTVAEAAAAAAPKVDEEIARKS